MLSALVPRGQVEGLRELAREHDRSVSAEIRQALREHLGAQEVSPPPPVPERGATTSSSRSGEHLDDAA